MSHRGSSSSLRAEEERDLEELRGAAAEFYRQSGVPQELEAALDELFRRQPRDLHGFLADYFDKRSAPPRISRLKGREVYNAKGQLCIEAEVFCVVRNTEKSISSAAVSCCLDPERTSSDTDDEEERTEHVRTAAQCINGPLSNMLKDRNPCDQSEVDKMLSHFFMTRCLEEMEVKKKVHSPRMDEESSPLPPPTQDKDKKIRDKGKKNNIVETPAEPLEPVLHGSTAIGSVSLAVAKAGAELQQIPLYHHIAALKSCQDQDRFHIPVSLVTLICCGRTSPGKLNLLEEVILVPKPGQGVKQIVTTTLKLQKEMMRIMMTMKAGAVQAIECDRGAPAVSFERPEQPLDLITEACSNLQLQLGTDAHLALNCAAHKLLDHVRRGKHSQGYMASAAGCGLTDRMLTEQQKSSRCFSQSKGKYEVAAGVLKSPDELVDLYQTLLHKHPAVVTLIDPFRGEDKEQWQKLSNAVGNKCSLLSEVTNVSQLPAGGKRHILKLVNETTISDLIRIASHPGSVMLGVTESEPCSDASLSDLRFSGDTGSQLLSPPQAVGLGLDYIKLGGLHGAERMTKYNRLISLEEELAQRGILEAGRQGQESR
ncbi:enolase 4 isoform X2 [Oryzias latipes]|uniref:enolase 4 isoform X2 n=1 Tax=Oryzias latipes TaxID=8090 RepID=UPI000CE19844|nr:enolase 4 isoform X2 [Oryzias latipes]